MVIKKYSDFTEEEKKQSQDIWVEILNTYCKEDIETGCRPCDLGCPCDRCHYDVALQSKYAKTLAERGVPLTEYEAHYLTEDD